MRHPPTSRTYPVPAALASEDFGAMVDHLVAISPADEPGAVFFLNALAQSRELDPEAFENTLRAIKEDMAARAAG